MDTTLTDREADVMGVLWEHGPSTVAEVREKLADPLAYTTVLTILRILESKGYIEHRSEGRGYRYLAVVKRQVVQRSALRHLTGKLFKGSSELLFAHLVADRDLTPEQIRRMRALLHNKRNKGDT